ncbi:MAG: Smr/MutS family protein [Burkholderiaceae bacterium]|nr:Smr/MutS family protein [Burkholderiaceae bacterium]
MTTIRSLGDLKQIKQEIAQQQAREAAALAVKLAAQALAKANKDLFASSVGRVKPLSNKPKVLPKAEHPEPIPVQRQRDEQAVLRESLSDEFDVETLLDVDDALSFRRPGIGTDVTKKLRQGVWSIQRQVDLHNLRTEQAREALGAFIREAHKHGMRCVRVVHGKGLGSPGKEPVLKGKVKSWLIQKQEVLAFVQAKPAEGGAGALVVLLKPQHG